MARNLRDYSEFKQSEVNDKLTETEAHKVIYILIVV